MVMFTVWTFPHPYAAEAVATRLQSLCAHELIRLGDAALLTWPHGRLSPAMRVPADLPRGWKLDDAFWGLLVGVLFHGDHLVRDPAPGPDALSTGLAHLGISTDLLDAIRGHIVAGTSALLLFVETEVVRRIAHALDGMAFVLLEAPISNVHEQWLRTTFSL